MEFLYFLNNFKGVGFLETYIRSKNDKFKIFQKSQDLVRHIQSYLGFIWRLPEDRMFFLTLNNCFKVRLLQITSHLNIRPLIAIHTNH
jgi:hypothetical protein